MMSGVMIMTVIIIVRLGDCVFGICRMVDMRFFGYNHMTGEVSALSGICKT